MSASTTIRGTIAIEGASKQRVTLTANRIKLALALGLVLFAIIGGRLIQLGLTPRDNVVAAMAESVLTASRPAILDRNGRELAIDLFAPSLYAEPRNIVDIDEAVDKISSVLPDLDRKWLREKLDGKEGFVWLQREMTPSQREKILSLGLPGVDFLTETRRYYPGGPVAGQILGYANIDNVGIAGIEQTLDTMGVAELQDVGLARGRTLEPVNLSVDLRVQYAMYAELTDAMVRYKAIAAAGVMLDVQTGEVMAMVSLPDFDPNNFVTAAEEGRFNRITAGKFELGSVFKSVSIAAALDSGRVAITDRFDARVPVRFGRFTITDFYGKNRILSVPEVYKYSSNIGTIRIMQTLGKERYREFLTTIGMDGKPPIELPERTASAIPHEFSDVGAATAAFGHGLSVTPLHLAAAYAALVNGGTYLPPTIFPRTALEVRRLGRRVISAGTSDQLRYLMRLNALEGSGRKASVEGYRVGGKTGTADKVVDGTYSSEKTLSTFASVFPMDAPRYAMIIMVDEPQRENPQSGTTAAWNAGATSGRIIARVAPMLGVMPDFDPALDAALVPAVLR
jgi:cell division protein FtsI (penicillin-binding protein 3)